jgi:hypothetical protein
MVSRTTIGKSFDGLVRYQYEGRRDQPADKQAEILASSGVSIESAAEMISDFNLGKAVNPGLGYPVWHTSLSFNPDDAARLDSAKMLAIAEGYLQKMGLDNTQHVIVRHHDQTDNQHLHIIANRVDYDGKTIDDGRNFYRSKLALRELVAEHGLTPGKGKRPELQHPERLRGTDLARHEMLTVVNQTLAAESQRPQLLATLRAAGLGIEERFDKMGRATGISFEKDGYKFKGSDLGRHLSSAGIDKQLAANAQKQQAAVTTSEVTTVSQLPASASAAIGSGVDKTSASPEKAGSMKLPQMPVGQLSPEESATATAVRQAVGDGQSSSAAQQVTTERDRLEEQAVAAVAAAQRERKLIADYEDQANKADRRDDVERMVELRFEEIPAAQKRLAAYEAAAKSTPFGSKLLAEQKEADAAKVQKEASPSSEENPVVSVPISRQQLALSPAVEPIATALPAESLPTSPSVPGATVVPFQQLPVVPIVVEEVPATKVPLEITPPAAPQQVETAQAKAVLPPPTATATSGVSKQLSPSASAELTPAPDPAAGLTPLGAATEQKSQPSVPVVNPPVGPPAAAAGPTGVASPIGATVTSRLPLGPAVPAVPTVVGPPIAQPPQSPEKVEKQLPAMSLAESLITALPDRPAATAVTAPVVVPEVARQYGIIRMQDSDKRTSEERLSTVSAALLKAGATLGEIVPPTPGRNRLAMLPYSFDPTKTSLEEVTNVLNDVQAVIGSKVQERPHPWHQPGIPVDDESLQWPDREGQFNQARLLLKDPTQGYPDAEAIAADLRVAGAQVSEIKRNDEGHLVMRVSYHTYAPGINTINGVLDRAAGKLAGAEVQESKQDQAARYEGAIQVTMKQQAAEKDSQQEL